MCGVRVEGKGLTITHDNVFHRLLSHLHLLHASLLT